MVAFYNAADQELYKKYKFLPQEQYRLGLNLPTTPDPVANQGIVNTNAFTNSGGGNDFNPAGNMFGEGTAVSPVYGGNPITGGFDGGYGADPISGDLPGGGNIVDEFGTDGEVYSKGSFDSLKSEEEKKGFLSKMMNSFRQRTANLPNWAKAGITAAGMINPLTAIPSLISKFGSGNGGPSYGIAGLDDQQKAMYNNLAASGYLYDTPGGMKTFDGKNFSQFDTESINNYFDSKTDKFGSIEEYEDYLNQDPKKRKNLIKTLQFYKQAKKGDDAFTDFSNITDPNITSDMIDEFTTTNNDGPGYTPPTAPPGTYYTNTYSGGDPSQDGGNQNNNSGDHDGGASADAQSDDAAGAGGYAKGGRAGYFFGGRVGYAEGGPIYSRLGTLSSGVLSAEQQLQGINASLQKAESDLGSESPGGGSSLAGGPSFTSNFEDANNQGPGSNLLFGGSMDQDSPTTPPVYNKGPESFGAIQDPITGGGPLQELQAANPISSIGGISSPPSTGGVKTGGAGQTLTGQELVDQIRSRMQQRDQKMPSFNAYAQEVIKTGGYPTKQVEDYSDLDSNFFSSKPMEQLQSSGGGLGGLFGGNKQNIIDTTPDIKKSSDPIMGGFQGSDIYKNMMGRPMTADSQNYTLDGKEMSGSGTYFGGLSKYLESIGKGNLLQRNNNAYGNAGPLQSLSQGIGSIL